MTPTLRNFLAFVAGLVFGSLVNMGIISISGSIIPPPGGADVTTPEGLKATMHLFEPKHFIFPFLAHALGTFAGAFLTAWLAASNKMRLAIGIGIFFLVGGIASVFYASIAGLVYCCRSGFRLYSNGLSGSETGSGKKQK